MDASVLEREKENIKPMPFGRSALRLGKALGEKHASTALSKQRELFESKLLSDEADDPLQIYVDYIAWTHDHFPQGATSESGLLQLLERCTSTFRDTPTYKNDPRYLKVWLQYAEYSNSPREIFVYLAKKSIAQELALYYEQFAAFLELKGLIADAQQVYEIGIERSAWPSKKLKRSFSHFLERTGGGASADVPTIRASLTPNKPLASAVWIDSRQPVKKQKLAVHQDEVAASIKETVFTPNHAARLNSNGLSVKENKIVAKPWTGEVIRQKAEPLAADKKAAKFHVFRDGDVQNDSGFEVREEDGLMYTIIEQPGKPREKICVNMKLLYPSETQEYSLSEIRAMSYQAPRKSKQDKYIETELTFTIPLRDDDTIHKPRSPTITMVSRMATNEVLGMFNDAALNLNLDDETSHGFQDSTNLDGFHTETIHVESQGLAGDQASLVATPPTDQYDSDDGSSPFLAHP